MRKLSLFLTFSLVLAACSAPNPTAAPTPSPALTASAGTAPASTTATPAVAVATNTVSAPTATAAASATPAAAAFTVGYVTSATGASATGTPGVLDALQSAAHAFTWTVQSASGGAADLTKLAQAGAQIIVADGADLASATRAAAGTFPKTYFVSLGQAESGAALPNLLNLGAGPSREDQLGFIAGVLGGYATHAKVLTAVGYTTDPIGLKYRNGFLHGVRLSCSKCRVDFVDLTDLTDQAAAAEKARLNASLSSDVVFVAAGGVSGVSGVALQAAAGAGAWVLGADTDVYQTVFSGTTKGADKVLGSAYFDPGAALTAALKAYQAGQPWTGAQPYSAATGAVVLSPFHVSADVLSDLDRSDTLGVLAQLADGSLDTGIDLATGNEQ